DVAEAFGRGGIELRSNNDVGIDFQPPHLIAVHQPVNNRGRPLLHFGLAEIQLAFAELDDGLALVGKTPSGVLAEHPRVETDVFDLYPQAELHASLPHEFGEFFKPARKPDRVNAVITQSFVAVLVAAPATVHNEHLDAQSGGDFGRSFHVGERESGLGWIPSIVLNEWWLVGWDASSDIFSLVGMQLVCDIVETTGGCSEGDLREVFAVAGAKRLRPSEIKRHPQGDMQRRVCEYCLPHARLLFETHPPIS